MVVVYCGPSSLASADVPATCRCLSRTSRGVISNAHRGHGISKLHRSAEGPAAEDEGADEEAAEGTAAADATLGASVVASQASLNAGSYEYR